MGSTAGWNWPLPRSAEDIPSGGAEWNKSQGYQSHFSLLAFACLSSPGDWRQQIIGSHFEVRYLGTESL